MDTTYTQEVATTRSVQIFDDTLVDGGLVRRDQQGKFSICLCCLAICL